MKNVTPLPPQPIELAQFVLMVTPEGSVTAVYRHKFQDNKIVESACSAMINFMVTLMGPEFIEENLIVPGEMGEKHLKDKLLQLVEEKNNEPKQ